MNTSTQTTLARSGYRHRPRTSGAVQRTVDDELLRFGVYVTDPRFEDPAVWKSEAIPLMARLVDYDEEHGIGADAEMNSAGTKIYLEGEGEGAILGVYIGNYHWLGYLEGLPMRQFLASSLSNLLGQRKRGAVAVLGDPRGTNGMYPFRPVGIDLRCSGGDRPGLKVCLGAHCLGVLRNPGLELFLDHALQRSIVNIDPKYLLKAKPKPRPQPAGNVISITDASAKAVEAPQIGEDGNRAS